MPSDFSAAQFILGQRLPSQGQSHSLRLLWIQAHCFLGRIQIPLPIWVRLGTVSHGLNLLSLHPASSSSLHLFIFLNSFDQKPPVLAASHTYRANRATKTPVTLPPKAQAFFAAARDCFLLCEAPVWHSSSAGEHCTHSQPLSQQHTCLNPQLQP